MAYIGNFPSPTAISSDQISNGLITAAKLGDASVDLAGAKVTGTLPIASGGTGATTASGARTGLGLGTIATQAANSVNIDGGAIDGTNIGAGTPGTGAFTDFSASDNTPTFSGSGALQVPSGTTGERPGTGANGMIRYNETLFSYEAYDENDAAWGVLGGGGGGSSSGTIPVYQRDNTPVDIDLELGVALTIYGRSANTTIAVV